MTRALKNAKAHGADAADGERAPCHYFDSTRSEIVSTIRIKIMARRGKGKTDELLVNKLSVKDATHLVRTEGGSLTMAQIVFRVITVVAVAGFTARAIVVGDATAWHLFLPMLGEYLVLLLSLPVINLIIREPELKKDAGQSLRLIFGLVVIGSLWIASRSFDSDIPFPQQAKLEFSRFISWITGHEMHWPILGAMAAMAAGIPARVAAFHRHGPPFVAVGMGCAMRLVIPLLGCFLLPVVASGEFPIVWVLWTILFLAEAAALLMHWDLQRRLKKRGIEV